ncbi:MAG: NADH-quinone oxidoreductase subunit A, partial [Calditrichota bacterium]
MSNASASYTALWPLLVYALAVAALVIFMIGFSYLLGQRHKERATGEIYESGIMTTGDARLRFSVHFYVVAMFFVI